MTTLPLTIAIPTDVRDLYCAPGDPATPWPVELALNLRTATLAVRHRPDDVAHTGDVYYGRELVWEVPLMRRAAYRQLLQEIVPIGERLVADSAIEYDVERQAHVGRLGEDAQAAASEITRAVEAWTASDDDKVVILDAKEWAADDPDGVAAEYDITASATPEQAAEIAERIEADIRADAAAAMGVDQGDVLVLGAREWVKERLREAWLDSLGDVVATLDGATELRDQLLRWLSQTGESSRELARRVGVSHTTVQRIVRGA